MSQDDSNLNSDQPIEKPTEDRFGRARFAKRVADVITRRDDPSSIVISVNAPWGDGKTSVLNMISGYLQEQKIAILTFNPWRFPDEDKLLKTFFLSLADTLGVKIETGFEKTGGFLRKHQKLAGIISAFGFEGDKVAEGLGELLSDASIEVLKERIAENLREKKQRIAILMDDIDRLDVNEIHAVFRLIKLSASFPFTDYVLSFDSERVAQALNNRYGGNQDAGKNFLEKIVQVSLPLPPASSTALMKLTIDGINSALRLADINLSEEEAQRFSEFFGKSFRSRIQTPRLSKRFANALTFALPLMKGEANPLDLIFIEAIKIFYPQLYATLRDNGDSVLKYITGDELLAGRSKEVTKELTELFTKALSDVPNSERAGIGSLLLNLLPALQELGIFVRPSIRPERDRIREKRISTREYFWRYFSYGIQPHDVSDNEISDFVNDIVSKGDDFVADYINGIFEEGGGRIDAAINKLRLVEDELDQQTSEKLALGIASLSNRFPSVSPDNRVLSDGVRYQIARLIIHLTKSLGGQAQLTLLSRVVTDTPSLSFAYDVADTLRAFGEKIESTDDSWVIVWKGLEREVNRIVCERIAKQSEHSRLEDLDFLPAQDLYLFWFFHDSITLSNYVKELTANGPEAIVSMISGLIGVNLAPKSKVESYFHRTLPWFGILASLVDPQRVHTSLGLLYPELDTKSSSTDTGERIAIEFTKSFKASLLANAEN